MHTCNNLNPHKCYILQEVLKETLQSFHLLKRTICNVTLPMINTTSPSPLSYAVVSFCTSNSTVFESTLHIINKVCLLGHTQHVGLCLHVSALLFFLSWNNNSKSVCLFSWLCFVCLWLSDTDGADGNKAWGDGDDGWDGSGGLWSAAESDLTVGQPASYSPALFFWFCWPSAGQCRDPTHQHTGVMYFYWWSSAKWIKLCEGVNLFGDEKSEWNSKTILFLLWIFKVSLQSKFCFSSCT